MKPFRFVLLLGALATLLPLGAGAQVVEQAPKPVDAPSMVVTHASKGPVLYPTATVVEPDVLLRPNIVKVKVTPKNCKQDACTKTIVTHNARTSAGAVYIAQLIDGATTGAAVNYVALSADTTTVANGDTTCPSEITTGGLARKAGSNGSITAPATLGAAATFPLTATWTATATATVNKICDLTASSGGTLVFETILGSTVSLNSGDSITLTWTFSV